MKRIVLLTLCVALGAFSLNGQDIQSIMSQAASELGQVKPEEVKAPKVNYWTTTLKTSVTGTHTALTNWAAGGDDSYTLLGYVDGNANYKKGDKYWNNRLQLDYGFLFVESKPILQKSNDRIYLESKYGVKINNKLSLTANYNFRSQFTEGYTYKTPGAAILKKYGKTSIDSLSRHDQKSAWKDARVGKSGALSPAYTNISLGIDYIPNKWLTINAAPLTGGIVIVSDPKYRSSYGMKLGCSAENEDYQEALAAYNKDKTNSSLQYDLGEFYKPVKFEFGAQVKLDAKANLNDNISGTTQLVLFSNYLENPLNLRVNWDMRINWKLAKYLTLTLATNLIYDDNIMIYSEEDGLTKQRIQFKEALTFGFTYSLAGKK